MNSKAARDALNYLKYRIRSTAEIRQYLNKKGHSGPEIQEAVEELLACGYLNDVTYAREYISYAIGRKKGKLFIISELKKRGLTSEDIEKGFWEYEDLEEIDIDATEYDRALSVAQKATADCEGRADDRTKARVARRLASMGYRNDTIFRVIDKC